MSFSGLPGQLELRTLSLPGLGAPGLLPVLHRYSSFSLVFLDGHFSIRSAETLEFHARRGKSGGGI